MKRYLGLDLGTKTLGVAITDKSNTIIFPHSLIKFPKEDYNYLINEVAKIIEKEEITDVVIGLPKNMDGSIGFAAQRTLDFIPLLKKLNVNVFTEDERLTTVEAARILREHDIKVKDTKNIIDMESAVIILEGYLRSITWEK